jgi:hypothetical protein
VHRLSHAPLWLLRLVLGCCRKDAVAIGVRPTVRGQSAFLGVSHDSSYPRSRNRLLSAVCSLSSLRSRVCLYPSTRSSSWKRSTGSTKQLPSYFSRTCSKAGPSASSSAPPSSPHFSTSSNGPEIVSYRGSWPSCKRLPTLRLLILRKHEHLSTGSSSN